MIRRWWWALLPLAATAGLVGVFASRFGHDPRFIPSPLIGKPAPQISAARLFAPDKRLDNAVFHGKVALFNVFASWCVACVDETSGLAYLHQQGVPIYGLDYADTREEAAAWLKRWGDPYLAIGYDPSGVQGANWGVWGVPETYVLNRKGRIVRKFTGPITREVARQEVLPLVRRLERQP